MSWQKDAENAAQAMSEERDKGTAVDRLTYLGLLLSDVEKGRKIVKPKKMIHLYPDLDHNGRPVFEKGKLKMVARKVLISEEDSYALYYSSEEIETLRQEYQWLKFDKKDEEARISKRNLQQWQEEETVKKEAKVLSKTRASAKKEIADLKQLEIDAKTDWSKRQKLYKVKADLRDEGMQLNLMAKGIKYTPYADRIAPKTISVYHAPSVKIAEPKSQSVPTDLTPILDALQQFKSEVWTGYFTFFYGKSKAVMQKVPKKVTKSGTKEFEWVKRSGTLPCTLSEMRFLLEKVELAKPIGHGKVLIQAKWTDHIPNPEQIYDEKVTDLGFKPTWEAPKKAAPVKSNFSLTEVNQSEKDQKLWQMQMQQYEVKVKAFYEKYPVPGSSEWLNQKGNAKYWAMFSEEKRKKIITKHGEMFDHLVGPRPTRPSVIKLN